MIVHSAGLHSKRQKWVFVLELSNFYSESDLKTEQKTKMNDVQFLVLKSGFQLITSEHWNSETFKDTESFQQFRDRAEWRKKKYVIRKIFKGLWHAVFPSVIMACTFLFYLLMKQQSDNNICWNQFVSHFAPNSAD